MLVSLAEALGAHTPDPTLYVLTASASADDAARGLGLTPIRGWHSSPRGILRLLEKLHLDAVWIIGADVIDGSYDALNSGFALVLADLAVRLGLRTSVVGFSFGLNPNRRIRSYFLSLRPGIRFYPRDRVSLDRFTAFTNLPAVLAADIAFLLSPQPGSASAPALEWILRQHRAGDLVLAFNAHPMLMKHDGTGDTTALIAHLVNSLAELLDRSAISLLLLAHDHRGTLGDAMCLDPVSQLLSRFEDRVYYCRTPLPAVEIKALVGHVDATITGRMHLAIASLGAGTPTAGFTYQSKFEGLFDLLGIPPRFLVDPCSIAADDGGLLEVIDDLVTHRAQLRADLQRALPGVLRLAHQNLGEMDPPSTGP
jgi:polysaccharide pyruvyl transferase WcaK-like protein